jgi:hypothetical protein
MWVYWSQGQPTLRLTRPVASLKLFVLSLLCLELFFWTAPELCVLATPELVELEGAYPPRERHFVVPAVEYLLPGMHAGAPAGSAPDAAGAPMAERMPA